MNNWYVVMCKRRREEVAEANLINQGYLVYLPRLATQCCRNGKWVDTVEPLFPCYLFIALGHEGQSLAPVRSTVGVGNLVRFGVEPAIVPEAVVESLRAQQQPGTDACARRSVFQAGATVEFRAGPFAGLNGVFDMEAGEDRVFVLLDFLGKINRVKVCRDWLAPAT